LNEFSPHGVLAFFVNTLTLKGFCVDRGSTFVSNCPPLTPSPYCDRAHFTNCLVRFVFLPYSLIVEASCPISTLKSTLSPRPTHPLSSQIRLLLSRIFKTRDFAATKSPRFLSKVSTWPPPLQIFPSTSHKFFFPPRPPVTFLSETFPISKLCEFFEKLVCSTYLAPPPLYAGGFLDSRSPSFELVDSVRILLETFSPLLHRNESKCCFVFSVRFLPPFFASISS